MPACAASDATTAGELHRRPQGQHQRMSISTPFIRRPIATSLLMAAILLVGIAAYPLLPVAPLPQVDFPTIPVTAQCPAPARRPWRRSVAQPLETQFARSPALAQMTSINVLGTSNDHAAVRPRPQHRRRRERRAGGDQRRARASCRRTCPARRPIRKVNPADAPILILAVQSDDAAADHGGRLRREHPGAADLADRRRRARC